MTPEDLQARTRVFARRIVKLVDSLPNTVSGRAIGTQLIRSGTSIGANYREACYGRSQKDFISKISIAFAECQETIYWLEVIADTELIRPSRLKGLLSEANELAAIFCASIKTSRTRLKSASLPNLQSSIFNLK